MIEDYGILNDKSPHILADLCEIICFFEDREVSRGDIESFVNLYAGEGLYEDLKIPEGSAEANERIQALSEEVFDHLRYRAIGFGDWYPFTVDADILVLADEITDERKIYVALLAMSRLKMFKRAEGTDFAGLFEVLCVSAAVAWAPGWTVLHLGKSGADRAQFGNKLKDCYVKIAEFLKEFPIERSINGLDDRDTGDGGLDLMIVKDWADNGRGKPVYFGQCAAQQRGWPEKRYEAHSVDQSHFIHFIHAPGTVLFIPLCFRSTDGSFVNDMDARSVILVDRLRIVSLFKELRTLADKGEIDGFPAFDIPFERGAAAGGAQAAAG